MNASENSLKKHLTDEIEMLVYDKINNTKSLSYAYAWIFWQCERGKKIECVSYYFLLFNVFEESSGVFSTNVWQLSMHETGNNISPCNY